ncbi:MAG: ATP-binding protein [Agriterribacter sp.]
MTTAFKVDLTNCDKEPIHIPGFVQSHGFLVAINPSTHIIEKVSENVSNYLGVSASQLLGKPASMLDALVNAPDKGLLISDLIDIGTKGKNYETNNPSKLIINNKSFDVVLHAHNNYIIVEAEEQTGHTDSITLQKIMTNALGKIQAAASLQQLLDNVASLVKDITGYDRVMVYKFHEDQHGEVIAEARNEAVEPFLHLHYPASDIPVQARALYKLNLVRLIADVNSEPSPLLGLNDETLQPLDLTHSGLRAVSPIHIEYLRNMGVAASFSISLIHKGELWGLIACHHYSARFVDYNSRMAAKFVGQLFSAALEFRTEEDNKEQTARYRANEQLLQEQMSLDLNVVEGLVRRKTTMLDINGATGAVLFFEGKWYQLGEVPPQKNIQHIIHYLREHFISGFFQATDIPLHVKSLEEFSAVASGVMVVEISPQFEEFIMWCKPEIIQNVNWAGNPAKSVVPTQDGSPRLSPRKSFEKWTQQVRYTSESWSNGEIGVAMKLKEDILHIINRKSSEIRKLNDLLRKAYEELDTFTYTISHDLKTPLSSIKNYSEIIVEDYGESFPEEARQLLQKVIKGTDKMNQLIRDVLHYTKVGRTGIKFAKVDMSRLLNDIKEEVLIAEKGKNISIHIVDPVDVMGDATMVMQLFNNLIGNAAKYSGNSKAAIVKIRAELVADGFVQYMVSDNGIGLDMKYAPRIFELFQRLDNAKGISGTGVGLAIVKRIVEKHGGKIWVESVLDNGTKFFVTLPKA